MKGLLLAFLAALVACTSTPTATPQRTRPQSTVGGSGLPSSPTSPAPTASVPPTRAVHLSTGEELPLGLTSIPTAEIRPDRDDTVLVFVLLLSVQQQTVPNPTVKGGGARWTLIENSMKSTFSSRGLTAFAATDVSPGRLTIGLPSGTRATTCWSIVEAEGSVLRTVANPMGALETSHSVTMPEPTGLVVAAWGIGQEVPAAVQPPFHELGQVHTVNPGATCLTAWGTTDTATATWSQPGHSIAIAVELG